VSITNDGATILQQMEVLHPTAKMLVELSKAQDIEAGDGTTSVVILSGSLLGASLNLIRRGISQSKLIQFLGVFLDETKKILIKIAIPVNLKNSNALYNAACTALESKVISSYCHILAPLAVKSILYLFDKNQGSNIDLKRIRLIKKKRRNHRTN